MTGRSWVGRFIDRAYVEIETALWAGLLAFAVFFFAAVLPRMPEQAARAESERILAMSDENHRYCEKWGKREGTAEHDACVLDLQQLRRSIEQRFAESVAF